MQLKTILNRIEPFKSFVYTQITMIDDGDRPRIEVAIEPRANGRRSARAAGSRRRAMIGNGGRGGSTTCRCGEWPCLFSTRCGG